MVCRRAWRPVCLHPRERWEGQTDTPQSAYPSCPLYHAWHSNRTLGRGGSHHRGCHDRSPWSCFTTTKIWLDEKDGRPVQSPPAPGTGRHRDPVARVTICPNHRERQWRKRSAVSALAILCLMSRIIRVPFLIDIIGFNQSRASSAHRMRGTGDDNSRGDCANRTQSPSRDPRCPRWSDVRHL